MRLKSGLIDEIRMNDEYTSFALSEYEECLKDKDSVPLVRKKTLLTRDFLRHLSSTSSGLVVLPPNCRYMEETNNGVIAVIEEPPAFRTITINMDLSNEINRLDRTGKLKEYGIDVRDLGNPPYSFTLAFPYVIFILWINPYNQPSYGEAYIRTQQILGLSDVLYKIPLLNISDSQSICFGDQFQAETSLNAAIQHAIMVFWSAEFNTDYVFNYQAYQDVPLVNTYLEWNILSQQDPMFIYNVNWIRMPMNLLQAIERVKRNLSLSSKRSLNYIDLKNIIDIPKDSGEKKTINKKTKKTLNLFFDLANELILYDETLNVGDQITFKSKTMHLYSLGGFREGGGIKYMQLLYNGRRITMKITTAMLNYLHKAILDSKYIQKAILSNGLEIQPGEIIYFTTPAGSRVYKKIEYIRNAFDGKVEANLSGDFFILENIKNAERFDMEMPKYFDIQLEKGKEYLYINNINEARNPLSTCIKLKFETVDVVRNNIVLSFRLEDSEKFNINLKDSSAVQTLFEIPDSEPIKTPFYIGRRLCSSADRYSDTKKHNPKTVWRDGHKFFISEFSSLRVPHPEDTAKLLDGSRLHIPGPIDIEFNIGENVVVADWEHPLEILSVKTIQGFKHDEKSGDISMILVNKHGNIFEQPYIQTGNIFTGKIRKVVTKFEDLSAGIKIQANTTGIPNFPKKDVNIIVAFVIDTGAEPLVLCSNGCTLWYSDVIKKFNLTNMKAPAWKSLQHVPLDLSKIKFQAGDIIRSVNYFKNDAGYLLQDPSRTRSLRVINTKEYPKIPSEINANIFDKYQIAESILDCIPEPRISPSKIREDKVFKGYPTFHGTYFVDERSSMEFTSEKGVLNVSSIRK